jgi:hypothetical protein
LAPVLKYVVQIKCEKNLIALLLVGVFAKKFHLNLIRNILCRKKLAQNLGYLYNFRKIAESKQPLDQSGHHVGNKKKNVCSVYY